MNKYLHVLTIFFVFSLYLLLVGTVLATCPAAGATSQGPCTPGTITSDTGSIPWSNPTNAATSNNAYATATLPSSGNFSNWLLSTNYGFSVPSTKNITNVRPFVERKHCGTGGTAGYPRLIKGGSIQGNVGINYSWASVDQDTEYTSSAGPLWGLTFTPNDINSSTFGFAMGAYRFQTGDCIAYIDAMSLIVEYTDTPVLQTSPNITYGEEYSRTGPGNIIWTVSGIEYDDNGNTGANALTWRIYTGANRTGTLVATNSFTQNTTINPTIAWNGSGLQYTSSGQTLYLNATDGTNNSTDYQLTFKGDNAVPASSTSISTSPSTVGTNQQYSVTFTPNDTISTDSNELRYTLWSGSDGTGNQMTNQDYATSGQQEVTNTFTDSWLVNGSNTRSIKVCDGANNCSTTNFTVTAALASAPSVTTSAASSITATSAVLNSTVNPNGASTNITYRYQTTPTATCNASTPSSTIAGPSGLTGTSNLSGATTQQSLTGLTANTTYYFCVTATNSQGTVYGSVLNFTTITAIPSLTLPTNTTPTSSTVTLGATVSSDNGSAISSRGVCYSLTATDSTPGFTTATGSTPESGVTCVTTSGTTGLFTIPITGLSASSQYTYRGFARNGIGNGYSSTGTFTTPTNAPTSVTTNNESGLASYKVTFNGSANPNGSQAYGYFRYFTSVPNCTVDSGGYRVPSDSSQDYNLGSGSSPVNFSINSSSAVPLTPNTNYWYCAYSRNVAAGSGSPGTSAAAGYDTFTTPDGQVSACDAPATGNLTIAEQCSFPSSDHDGVDAGTGADNSGRITLASGGRLAILPGQRIGRGSTVFSGGSLILVNGGASMIRGGVWLKDSDEDGYLDQPIEKMVSGTQPTGYIRRNQAYIQPHYNTSTFQYASDFYNAVTLAPTSLDCDATNGNIYRTMSNMVTDEDHDGYKTATSAQPRCVGDSVTDNGRTYYKNDSGVATWLSSSQWLGGGATDCQDNPNGAPCAPVNASGTNGTNPAASAASTTQINLSWGVNSQGGAAPAVTGYDVQICGLNDSTCASVDSTQSVSNATFSYNNSGITCSTSPSYYYRIVAKNTTNGNTNSNIFSGVTSTCSSEPSVFTNSVTVTTTSTADLTSQVNPNGATTTVYYRYGTSNAECSSLPSVTSGTNIGSGTEWVSPITRQITGLSTNRLYYWCAYAVNTHNTVYGNVQNFYTMPNVPTNPAAAKNGNQQSINVTWTASSGGAAGGYRIYYCAGAGCTPTTSAGTDSSSPYTHSGLSCSSTYGYRIVARSGFGDETAPTATVYASTTSGSQVTCYADPDNDQYTIASPATTTHCGSCDSSFWETSADTGSTIDCYEGNASARPTSGSNPHDGLYRGTDRGDGSYDWNCNGSIEKGQFDACTSVQYQPSWTFSPSCSGQIYQCTSAGIVTPPESCGVVNLGYYSYSPNVSVFTSGCSGVTSINLSSNASMATPCR